MKKTIITILTLAVIVCACSAVGYTYAQPDTEILSTVWDTTSEVINNIDIPSVLTDIVDVVTGNSEDNRVNSSDLDPIEDVEPDTVPVDIEPAPGMNSETFDVPETTEPETTVEETVHVHNEMVKVTPATCVQPGYSTYICVDCGYSYITDTTETVEHEYSEWVITQAPTCVVEGIQTRTCVVCGHTQAERLLVPGHQYELTVIEPTCTQEGYTQYQCKRCAETRIDSKIPATGHTFGSWSVSREATTTTTGTMTRKCTVCKHAENKSIPTKAAVNLDNITPTDLFAELDENERNLLYLIVNTVSEYYEQGAPAKGTMVRIAEDHGLVDDASYYRVCSQLCFYYGVYYEIWDYASFYYGARHYLYVDMGVFCEMEGNRRAMMDTIDAAIAKFADGTEEELVMQACYYLSDTLSYNANQAAAVNAFNTKKGSCNAYSILMKLMLHRLGIPCDFVTGHTSSGGYHAWVQVRYSNGNVKYYDLTFYESTKNTKWLGASKTYHNLETIDVY